MFKNPLKYQQGGSTQDAMQQLVAWIVQNTGLDEGQVSQRLSQILSDDTAKQELVNNLQSMQKGDQEAAERIKSMFVPQSAKFGGKIQDFICKHAKGGKAGCGCKENGGNVTKAQNGGGRSMWGPVYTDNNGRWRNFYDEYNGAAGTVNMNTGKAYRVGTDEEMLQPGRYNRRGYPIAEGASTNGTWYEVTPRGGIVVNIPEGGQQVLHGADSSGVANLINQWDQSKVGHAVTAKENGGNFKKKENANVEMHQQKNKGRGKLSTPVSTTPKDSSKVEYNPSMQTLSFEDENGNNVKWTRNNFWGKPDGTYNWRSGKDMMFFNPNQNDGFIPYNKFKQWNTGIEGSTYLSPEDDARLKNLYEYARNKRTYIEPHYSWDSSIAERFWYWLKSLNRDKELTPGAPTFWEQTFKNGGKVEKAQSGTRSLYQQITADGPETYTDGYGTVRQMNESPVIAGLRKAYHWINMDRTLSDNAYSQKHGYSKPIAGMPPAVYVSPVAQEIELAKIIGNRIPKQKPTIRISENLGNGKFSAIDDFGRAVIYDAERDKGLFQVIDKNDVIWKPGKDLDIDKLYGQSLPMFEPIQYNFSKLGRITTSLPELIGKAALKWAPGIVGSAAAGSYMATKNNKEENKENKENK